MPRWLRHWLERHRHPASLLLHLLAIPMLPAAAVLAIIQLADSAWSLWWRPVGLFLLSYLLQWIGHRIEGNDMGEIILVKKLLGKPYVAVANRRQPSEGPSS
jgi:hypothetical protein